MKQFVAFFVLFCLTFLNVPRAWVHECEHEHIAALNDDNSDAESSFENEECFICVFDLDVYQTASPVRYLSYQKPEVRLTAALIESLSNDEFDEFSHRGPPVI